MNSEEATQALAQVDRTRRRLANVAQWPFHRHAMFGLGEGLLVAAAAQPVWLALSFVVVGCALFVVCIADDRQRHGMFISGWQGRGTRPLVIALALFVVAMVFASVRLQDGGSVQPIGYLLGFVSFLVCTAASLLWQKIYRAELSAGAPA